MFVFQNRFYTVRKFEFNWIGTDAQEQNNKNTQFMTAICIYGGDHCVVQLLLCLAMEFFWLFMAMLSCGTACLALIS